MSKRPRQHRLLEHGNAGTFVGLPVVGIGASAGGLEAFQKLFDALPSDSGMAFILVQHLDPAHPSMMVELLAKHTAMRVQQAADGMPIEPDCVYVIPPGTYLALRGGALRLSKPQDRHGTRLAFDFLLNSLAEEIGERAACVVLSGTGADGSAGLKAINERCGLVIAQDPDEAGFDGMPQNAILTGAVDLVLPVAEIPQALVNYFQQLGRVRTRADDSPQPSGQDLVPDIIDLLHAETEHDFSLYKPGTLRRRIERRMALASIESGDMGTYLEILKSSPREIDLLVKDLLINVTGFFRDPETFDFLAEKVVPDLVRGHSRDRPVRIWSVGCSTGEEAYSLAMLFLEHIEDTEQRVRLQVFASDIDAEAIATAREGLYPDAIEADLSPERLARYFTKEDQGYRISPDLREAVVFTLQDVLTDPPFSRIDLISCRNLLIYLQPEAQTKAISLFHFALREDGVLLLGNAESIGDGGNRFEQMSKKARIYRHIARSRPGELGFSIGGGAGPRVQGQPKANEPSRQATYADLCQRLLLERHTPAAALINRQYEILFTQGPVDKYLRVASGHPTNDIFAMARDDVRTKLRAAVQRAIKKDDRIEYAGGSVRRNGKTHVFDIEVRPVSHEDEHLLFICFIDKPQRPHKRGHPVSPTETSKVAQLEEELETTRTELSEAMRNLEDQARAQKEINEEALSINEEFQATNEELETSKEELQSLNEELTVLNSQLQETLERERTAADDLQNILYSTDVATLFLDTDLNIRFFTPATRSLFSIIPGDIGRPLSDLQSLAGDSTLLEDARTVLQSRSHAPIEREIEAAKETWFFRRVLPYRTRDDEIGGVVITFTNITEQRRAADALEEAKRQAEQANLAKSRFLAAASHDLRQPLQTLTLIQALLAKTVEGEKVHKLVARLGEISNAMSGMLNALLDLNQIEAGIVNTEIVDFTVDQLLGRLRDEFIYLAESKGIDLRVVPSSQMIRSDPRLLEQMIRNLLSNALKYTRHGKVLLGCRRRGEMLHIQVCDTGIGVPDEALQTIFEEYHQIDNPARERNRGLGLGLSIVERIAGLLGHRVHARSKLGQGSVFTIEVSLAPPEAALQGARDRKAQTVQVDETPRHTGVILLVEDDPEVGELLKLTLEDDGHLVEVVPDGIRAMRLIEAAAVRPDLIVADYNLPNDMNGLQFIEKAQQALGGGIPAIILTGDIATGVLREIARRDYAYLSKPVQLADLIQTIQTHLPAKPPAARTHDPSGGEATDGDPTAATPPVVYIVDDDSNVIEELRYVLEEEGMAVKAFSSAETFLDSYRPGDREACLLVDARLPGLDGVVLLERLAGADHRPTSIVITGKGDTELAVRAMRAGASDFIEKPIGGRDLVERVRRALDLSRNTTKQLALQREAAQRLAGLTPRQREIMDMVLAGHPSKNIAADFRISQRTVENHRAAIMKRAGVKSLPALARLVFTAARPETTEHP